MASCIDIDILLNFGYKIFQFLQYNIEHLYFFNNMVRVFIFIFIYIIIKHFFGIREIFKTTFRMLFHEEYNFIYKLKKISMIPKYS